MDQAAPSAPLPRRRWAGLLAVVLLGLFWWSGISASRHWSQTSDELPHITAGYAYNQFGDYRIQPENGNLPQRIQGLAPLALGAKFPLDNLDYWRRSVYWQQGWDFLYGLDNPTDRMVLGARALNALFGVALGAFIFVVARRWYGDAGGLLALAFYVFCPNFLAHGFLATSDLAGTLCLTLAPWLFWRHLERRDGRSGLIAGIFSGLALVAKFNGILIAPLYAGLALADAWARADAGARLPRLARNVGLGLVQAGAGVLVIWIFFGFRYQARAPALPELVKFAVPWADMLPAIGFKAALIEFALRWHLFPEAWLYGLTNVLAGAAVRPAFLAGEITAHGWWVFFPILFLTKTTLGMLGALALAAGVGVARFSGWKSPTFRAALLRWLPLAWTALLVWLVALTSNLNIGHRHILAVYPALFVGLGSLATLRRAWLLAPLLLGAVHLGESVAIRPHYLAYFNAIGGGPTRAYRLVVDSSLDWGQSLPALREWVAANRRPGEKFYLSYFGSAWTPHYGVRPDIFLPGAGFVLPPFQPYELEPGLYAISATSLAEVYSDFRGPWRPEWSTALTDPATPPLRLTELRFARLCKYLQHRPPDAEAGYSILIFRLDASELRAALEGPVTGW